MKRISTLLTVLTALLALSLNGMAAEVTFDFQNNNGNWTVGEGANYADGDLNYALTIGDVTLTTSQGESKNPCRLMKNASKGIYVQSFKGTSLTLSTIEGMAITKIEVTMQTGSFDMTPSTGEVADNVWTGNATEVTFLNEKGSRYIWKIVVTTADATAETYNPNKVVFDIENNNGSWPVGEGANYADGNVSTLTMSDVTLTGIQGDSKNPVRIMKNSSRGICLWMYKGTSVKFNAPEGKALVKIEPTMQSGTFDLTASSGAVADGVWTGNATEVTFGPNANSTRYVYAFTVTMAAENEETVKPAAADVEVATIAEFNAVEDGKLVKLTLTDARVNGYWDLQGAYFVEDATGATVVKGAELTKGTVLNGAITGTKATNSDIDYVNTPAAAVEYQMNVTDASAVEAAATTLAGTVMSITDACAQANYGKLVTLEDVTISGSGQNKTLTDASGNTMKARDYMGVLSAEYAWPEKASKITGIIVYYMTGWFLMPISEEAIVGAGEQPSTITFDFTSADLRGYVGEKIGDVKGWFLNETYTIDNTSLQITAGSAPSRIFTKSASVGNILAVYSKYATMTFRAPAGYAITKIELADKNSTGDAPTVTVGIYSDFVWTGNADGVRFLNSNGTLYLANAVVTLAEKTAETETLADIAYAEAANIAAFNAMEDGSFAKVALTDAEVVGKSADGYTTAWIQDATGGCWIQYTSAFEKLTEGTKVNGYIYATKRLIDGSNVVMNETEDTPASALNATAIDNYSVVELAAIGDITSADTYVGRVVKLTGASFVASSATAGMLTLGEESIKVDNGSATGIKQLHKITDTWTKDETTMSDVTIVAILVSTGKDKSKYPNKLLPISMTSASTGIRDVEAEVNAADVKMYNLQGVRTSRLQKGLNIINGKKVVVK